MQESRATIDWLRQKWVKLLIATLALLALILLFLLLPPDHPRDNRFLTLLRGLIPGSIAVILGYLTASILLFRGGTANPWELEENIVQRLTAELVNVPGIIGIYTEIDEVPWQQLFGSSREVDIIARFFDGIVKDRSLKFFRNGGSVSIVTWDPRQGGLLSTANVHRNAMSLPHRENVKNRLLTGLRLLDNARVKANAEAKRLDVFVLPYLPNYAGYCFDNRMLVLLPYEHGFDPECRAPRLLLDLAAAVSFRRFWENEMKVLKVPKNRVQRLEDVLSDEVSDDSR